VELLAADGLGVAQEERVDDGAGPERVAGGSAGSVRHGVAHLLDVTEVSGGGRADSSQKRVCSDDRRSRESALGGPLRLDSARHYFCKGVASGCWTLRQPGRFWLAENGFDEGGFGAVALEFGNSGALDGFELFLRERWEFSIPSGVNSLDAVGNGRM